MCVAAAVAGAAVVGAVGSHMAANKQADAQQNAAQTQRNMFNRIQGYEQPFREAGTAATGRLSDLLGTSGNTGAQGYGSLTQSFTPADYLANKDPGYEFQLQQGQQAVRNADTPGSGALSGTALKDLIGFNQGMASTGYQNAFNRFTTQQNNVFSRLSDIANLGQNATAQTAATGTTLGQGIAQAQAGAGASQAAGIVGATNSLTQSAVPLGYFMNNPGTSASTGGLSWTGSNSLNPGGGFNTSGLNVGGSGS